MSSVELAGNSVRQAIAAGNSWVECAFANVAAADAADAAVAAAAEEEIEIERERAERDFENFMDAETIRLQQPLELPNRNTGVREVEDYSSQEADLLFEDPCENETAMDETAMDDDGSVKDKGEGGVQFVLDLVGNEIIDHRTSAGRELDAKSTKRVYKRLTAAFQKFVERVDALPGKGGLTSFDVYLPEARHDYVNRHLVRFFIKSYVKSAGYSQAHFTEGVNFMQRMLDDQMAIAGVIPRKGVIKEDKYLKEYLNEVQVLRAQAEKVLAIDMQESLDNQISRAQELLMVDICYNPAVVSTLSFLPKSNVVCGYTHSAQVGTRGSDSRGMKFHHSFTRKMAFLGDGEDVDNFIHNEGKTNHVGRRDYKAFACHKNPRMDTSAHLGINLLLRFIVYHEPFPDFLDYKDYTLRPVFRSVSSFRKSYPSSTQYHNWKAIYNAAGVHCAKVTHQNRSQVQQRLSDLGCPLDTIERFIGYAVHGQKAMNGAMRDSYLTSTPVQPVCGAADGDPNHPELHKPGWSVDLLSGELVSLCPWLYDEMEKVDSALLANPDHQKRVDMCLIQAKGCLMAFQRRIGQAVLMLASLPVDEKNNLLAEMSPMFVKWSQHPVVMLDYFRSQVFYNICGRVQTSQIEESKDLAEELSVRQRSWVSKEMGKIMPKLSQGNRISQSILLGQRQSTEHITSSLELVHQKMDWIIKQLSNGGPSAVEEGSISSSDSNPPPARIRSTPLPQFLPPNPDSVVYDTTLNSKGKPRKHRPPFPVLNRPFSGSNVTANDYWLEYKYGVNGSPSLESLEFFGTKWRSDTSVARAGGKSGTSLKAAWSLQKPVYLYIQAHIQMGSPEEVAIQLIQEVFDECCYKSSGRPKLSVCKKEFVKRWGDIL